MLSLQIERNPHIPPHSSTNLLKSQFQREAFSKGVFKRRRRSDRSGAPQLSSLPPGLHRNAPPKSLNHTRLKMDGDATAIVTHIMGADTMSDTLPPLLLDSKIRGTLKSSSPTASSASSYLPHIHTESGGANQQPQSKKHPSKTLPLHTQFNPRIFAPTQSYNIKRRLRMQSKKHVMKFFQEDIKPLRPKDWIRREGVHDDLSHLPNNQGESLNALTNQLKSKLKDVRAAILFKEYLIRTHCRVPSLLESVKVDSRIIDKSRKEVGKNSAIPPSLLKTSYPIDKITKRDNELHWNEHNKMS